MDVSHITALLSNLGKNQVTLQINCNGFEETLVEEYYMKNVSRDIFADLDDLALVCNKSYKSVPRKSTVTMITKPTKINKIVKPEGQTTTKYNLIYAMACIRDTLLTLETRQDKIFDVTKQFLTLLKDFVAQCPVRRLNIEINEEKVSKDVLLQFLDIAIEHCVSATIPIQFNHYEVLVKVVSRFLHKNIAILQTNANDNDFDVLAKEYLETNENSAEYVTIMTMNTCNFVLGDTLSAINIDNVYKQNAIRKLKQQDGFVENLKHQCVKDLRFIAKDIGIDIVDTHTGKLYSKSDLKQLIEAQLRTYP